MIIDAHVVYCVCESLFSLKVRHCMCRIMEWVELKI